MNEHPIANSLRSRGNRLIALGQYEEALQLFLKALELDPEITVAYSSKTDMEKFIREGGRQEFIKLEERKQEADPILRQRFHEAIRRRQIEDQRIEDNRRLSFNDNLSRLVQEIQNCANERPCPKCNELEVLILSLSPNARSMLVRCRHCQHEYRIKMEPADPQKITELFNSFIDGREAFFLTKDTFPEWRMEIIQRRITNQRSPIPTDVKKAVWKRDGGKCVYCGSQVDLEYDHIIPVTKGGSSTVQNIQILCKRCNRKKHASLS